MREIGIRGVLLVCGYAIVYWIFRELSVSHWLLPAGLRFAALLFLPYRYWPFAILGEIIPSAAFRWDKVDAYGWPWLVATLAGGPVSTLLPVLTLRKLNWGRNGDPFSKQICQVLAAALLASLMSATAGVMTLDLIHYGIGSVARVPGSPGHYLAMFTVGDFLGILAVLPVTATVMMGKHFSTIVDNDLRGTTQGAFIWLLVLCAMVWFALLSASRQHDDVELQGMARTMMLLPAVLMTIRFGWLGALPTVLMGNVLLQATMLEVREGGLVEVQFLMAIVGAGLLVFGATKTEHGIHRERAEREKQKGLDLARSNLAFARSWALQSASILEEARAAMSPQDRLALDNDALDAQERARMRWAGSSLYRSDLDQHISSLRLSDLHAHGLKLALSQGHLREMLERGQVQYRCAISGQGDYLPSDLVETVYRLVEGFCLRLARETQAGRIRVRVYVNPRNARLVAIVVKGSRFGNKKAQGLPAPYFSSLEARNIAATYQGIFHDRTSRRPSLSVLLHY